MPDLSNLVLFHSGQVRNFYLPALVLGQVLFTCPGTSLKKVNTILYFIFDNYYDLMFCVENSEDPDQLASSEAS